MKSFAWMALALASACTPPHPMPTDAQDAALDATDTVSDARPDGLLDAPDAAPARDAYARFDPATGTFALGTARIEKRVRFADGHLTAVGLTDRLRHRDLVQSGHAGVEFQITADGVSYNGASTVWTLDDHTVTTGTQGETRLDVSLHVNALAVTLHYVAWPGTGVIEQAIDYTNRTSASYPVGDPEMLDVDVMTTDFAAGTVTAWYATGGRNTADALHLHSAQGNASWSMSLASAHYGGSDALQEMVYRNGTTGDGLLMGWSYASTWYANFAGNGRAQVDANGENGLPLRAGATLHMPWTHTMVFTGDLDDAGNDLKDFQYRYKWDRTHDAWVGAVKPYLWDAGHSYDRANTFALTQQFRAVGADVWHWDADWYPRTGDWDDATPTPFAELTDFASRSGMVVMVWLPPWDAAPASRIRTMHPEWVTGSTDYCNVGGDLSMSDPDAVAWMSDALDAQTTAMGGPWIWRQDMGGGVFDGADVDPIVAHNQYFALMERFHTRHPDSGINVNHCGGRQLSLEAMRYADLFQTTDGASGHWSIYTPSYFYPPDKLWGTPDDDGSNPSWAATAVQLRASLATAWQWDGNGRATDAQIESVRRAADTYHFMTHIGLAGRGVHVFHPDVVERDDPSYYVQRMSPDGLRGVIIPLHAHADPAYVIVHPKGLQPTTRYTLRFENSGFEAQETGSYWMTHGIGATDWGGDLVWLNVTTYPGAHTDTTPPAPPSAVTRSEATYLGQSGVALTWTAGRDENWLAYHEVLRDGVAIGRIPRAGFHFDPAGRITQRYEVRAVDGDGNASALVTAP